MTNRWTRRITALLTLPLLLGLAGCAIGSHRPAPSSSVAPSPTPTANPLPPRPATLRLDGINPCALLIPAQGAQLGVHKGDFSYDQDGTNNPICQWDNYPDYAIHHKPRMGYVARLQLHQGVEDAISVDPNYQLTQIDGFTAVSTTSPGQDPNLHCILLVDVAPGESLWAQFDTLSYPGLTHQMSCQFAQTFGADLMQSLQAQVR